MKIVKMTLYEGQMPSQSFDFSVHLSTFRDENKPKIVPYKSKNNNHTQTAPKKLSKILKKDFFPQKSSKWPSRAKI